MADMKASKVGFCYSKYSKPWKDRLKWTVTYTNHRSIIYICHRDLTLCVHTSEIISSANSFCIGSKLGIGYKLWGTELLDPNYGGWI